MRVSAVLILFVLSILGHALLARWLLGSFAALRKRRRLVLAIVAVLAVLPTLFRALTWVTHASFATALFSFAIVEFATVLLSAIPLAFITLGGAAVARVTENTSEPPDAARPVSRREAIERIAGVSAIGATGLALGWGMVRGRHAFVLEEVVVRVPNWPRALDGYVIAQISDIHVGAFVGDRELDEGFELVRRARPDLLVATGDLVDFVASEVDPLARRLAMFGARDGAFAIVGNHDHYAGPGEVARRLRAAGVRVLCNEGVPIRAGDGGGFALLGVDDLQARRRPVQGFPGPDLSRALLQVREDMPRILLAHQPEYFHEASGRVSLQLSGHTHGGQINPGFSPARLVMNYVQGRYQSNGSVLWVNRGFGVAGPPSRIGAPPEVTRIVLVS